MVIDPKPSSSLRHVLTTPTRPNKLWRWLLEPAASLPEEQRLQARLLSALLLVFGLGLLLAIVVPLPGLRGIGHSVTPVVAVVLSALAYGLSRTKYYSWAAFFSISLAAFAPWALAAVQPAASGSYFMGGLWFVAVSIVLCGLLLSPLLTAVLAALQLSAILLAGVLFPALTPLAQVAGLLVFVTGISALAIATAFFHEQQRQENRRQATSLRNAEERFHLVSFATGDVVWDWNLSTGQVWRNQGIQRLFGFQAEQIGAGMDWWEEHIHPADREKVVAGLRSAIDEGEQFWSKEYRFQRVDGSYADIFDRAYILRDDDGRPTSILGALMDITARKHAEEVLRQEAVHDPLTGLFNRRYMEEMLEREMFRAQRNRQPIGIIMLDIDRFKQVNDTFGHAAGDAMLHKLGTFLLEHVRGTDIACRYGGDEFVLILPNASLEVARQRAELLCAGAHDLNVDLYGKSLGPLSLSLGVAIFPRQGSTRAAILQTVDAALYSAKEAGRNQVFVAQL